MVMNHWLCRLGWHRVVYPSRTSRGGVIAGAWQCACGRRGEIRELEK